MPQWMNIVIFGALVAALGYYIRLQYRQDRKYMSSITKYMQIQITELQGTMDKLTSAISDLNNTGQQQREMFEIMKVQFTEEMKQLKQTSIEYTRQQKWNEEKLADHDGKIKVLQERCQLFHHEKIKE